MRWNCLVKMLIEILINRSTEGIPDNHLKDLRSSKCERPTTSGDDEKNLIFGVTIACKLLVSIKQS